MPDNKKLFDFIKRHYKSLIPFISVKKSVNILLALAEMHLPKRTCSSRPFVYKIEPCSLCNLKCISCTLTTQNQTIQGQRIMALDDFTQVIDRISANAIRISLSEQGEPLLNRDIYKMSRYATDNRISSAISTDVNHYDVEQILQCSPDPGVCDLSNQAPGSTAAMGREAACY
jgi:sulfatase maturation enzyme AslB (radical SAM superfamily)